VASLHRSVAEVRRSEVVTERLVSVALPVGLDRAFTYSVPQEWTSAPEPGARVLVPFGARGLVGVVRDAVGEPTAKLRRIEEVLDPPGAPSLTPGLGRLCEWVHDYYAAPVGEVYRLALPGLLTGSDVRRARLTAAGSEALASSRAFVLTPRGAGRTCRRWPSSGCWRRWRRRRSTSWRSSG
jgi:primosomal protein N' (replication factor Y)